MYIVYNLDLAFAQVSDSLLKQTVGIFKIPDLLIHPSPMQ
jgi:hypothetical protein